VAEYWSFSGFEIDMTGLKFFRRGAQLLGLLFVAMQLVKPAAAIEIGSKVGNFQLPDVSGTTRSLQSYSGKIVILVFWSFKCPVSLAYDDRIEMLQKEYAVKGVAVLGVASGANETADEIRANTSNLKIGFPVLLDSEGNLAGILGATHTPGIFILDGSANLRYRGSLDNNKKPGESGRAAYAEDAINALLAGRSVAIPETRPFGCGIRRKTQ
jgi:peroxiredoxin